MSRYRKFTTICCAAVFALGLAACGGGGNSGPNTSQEQMLQEQVATLQGQINALRAQLGLAADDNLGDSIESLQMEVARLQKEIQDAKDEVDAAARKAMIATAAKLYAGISAPTGDASNPADGDRAAAYNTTATAVLVSSDADLTATGHSTAATLSEDKKTTVAANHGWAGKRYADPAGGDMYEAFVYSNIEAPTQGKKFGGAAANNEFEYALTSGVTDSTLAVQNGEVGIATGVANTTTASELAIQARVAIPSVTRTAGTETIKFSPSDPSTLQRIDVSGSYHGVSGTYYCKPTSRTAGCSVSVAAKGFALGGGDWAFKPSDPNARVMSSADSDYASYGWWIHKSADGKKFTASTFFDYKGGDGSAELASGLDTLQGTATYMGGAAGKYALSSSTGGTNDAGHFTARATLEADFSDNMISGTIDNFMGTDGMARDWSVELMDTAVSATGVIVGDGTAGNTDRQMTKWTIGGTAGAASGEWVGQLYDNGTDGVPKTAAGTFFSTYGQGNSIAGAFCANKQ